MIWSSAAVSDVSAVEVFLLLRSHFHYLSFFFSLLNRCCGVGTKTRARWCRVKARKNQTKLNDTSRLPTTQSWIPLGKLTRTFDPNILTHEAVGYYPKSGTLNTCPFFPVQWERYSTLSRMMSGGRVIRCLAAKQGNNRVFSQTIQF